MKKYLSLFFVVFLLVAMLPGEGFGASSSSSYKITTEVLDTGSQLATSSSYKLLGKGRERQLEWLTSSSYNLGEGFLRTAYFTTIFGPIVLDVTPGSGPNSQIVTVTITGLNFQSGAATKLSKSAQPDIAGTSITVVSSTEISCQFDLRGVQSGAWDVTVTNPDTKSGTLPSGFTVRQAPIEIVGRPLNYPNPFDPGAGPTIIRYTLTGNANIDIFFYNINGERIGHIKILAGEEGGKLGVNNVPWNAEAFGQILPNGVYVCQITYRDTTLGLVKIAILR